MTRTLRHLTLAALVVALVSGCSVLSGLIPDQTIDDGVLGIGTAGVQVTLEADVEPTSAVGGAQLVTVTVFTGSLGVADVDVPSIDALPSFVVADAITETIALGDSVEVVYPTGGVADSFTLTALEVGGTVTISGATYPLPTLAATGLAVVFGDASCVLDTCTYGTASNLPEFDVELAASAVAAYSALLKDGGTISATIVVTATLAAPGLAADAQVTVTLESLGAVIEF